jgi:hypothetical protein
MKYPEDRVTEVWQVSGEGVVYPSLIAHEEVDKETMFGSSEDAQEYAKLNDIEVTRLIESAYDGEAVDPEEAGPEEANLYEDDEARGKVIASFDELKDEDFRTNGVPKVGPVRELSGIDVSADDLEALWAEYAEGSDDESGPDGSDGE